MNLSRRDFLRVCATTPLALAALPALSVDASIRETRLPLLTIFLSGGASAKETWNPDPPSASSELRGSLGGIQTETGNFFCELFPMLASKSSHFALIRSLDAGSTNHVDAMKHAALHGTRTLAEEAGERATEGGVPYVFLNPGSTFPSVTEAFRSQNSFSPLWDSVERRFRPPVFAPPANLRERRELLKMLDTTPVVSPAADRMQSFRETAFDLLLGGGRFFAALDMPEEDRERYGRNLTGDMVLTAKRFIEAGAGAVTVYHEPEGVAWDLHNRIEEGMRRLSPELDHAAAELVREIAENRMECVLLLMGEFSRTPRINASAGRDHWQEGNCAILAGGNVLPGVVHGRTDMHGRIVDGAVRQQEQLGNTVIMACGGEVNPASPKVREVLRSGV